MQPFITIISIKYLFHLSVMKVVKNALFLDQATNSVFLRVIDICGI